MCPVLLFLPRQIRAVHVSFRSVHITPQKILRFQENVEAKVGHCTFPMKEVNLKTTAQSVLWLMMIIVRLKTNYTLCHLKLFPILFCSWHFLCLISRAVLVSVEHSAQALFMIADDRRIAEIMEAKGRWRSPTIAWVCFCQWTQFPFLEC